MSNPKIDRYLRAGVLVLTSLLVYVIYAAIHERVIAAGDTAPEFTIQADGGRTIRVPDFGGKLLVLNFWATWCPPCVQETPSLSEFARQYANRGVVVLGISVDQNEKAYRGFIERFRPNFLTAREFQIHEDYGTYMYPETYIIDTNGKVLRKYMEAINWMSRDTLSYIDSLL